MIEAYIELERHAHEAITTDRDYIEVDWEVLLREQAEDFADAVVWFFKFSTGNPGFVELFEDVNYISHRPVTYSQDQQEPKRRRDRNDDTLIHEQYRQYLLVWDKNIHLIAEMYRKLASDAVEQLNAVFEKIKQVSGTLPPQAQSEIDQWLLSKKDGRTQKIADALYIYNFKEAKRHSKSLIQGIEGQFNSRKVLPHRVRRVVKEVEVLQGILTEAFVLYMQRTKALEQDEKDLLSMFLGQRFENLW